MRRSESISSPRCRRPAWRSVLAFGLVAAVAPIAGADPAGASPAPLVTEDGVGIRVDETAIQGAVLEAIETATQGFVDDMIFDGGVDGAPLSEYESLTVSSNLELSFDVLPPSGGRPDGGLAVHADIQDIELEYRADPWWPWDDCSIWIRPDDATIDVTASVDRDALPAAPIIVDPVSATWDDDPTVDYSGVCWWYLIDNLFEGWWNDFIGNDPESTASRIEAEINGIAQDLIDQIWDENVAPVLDSLESFGISINQLRTDDHGLIVTADVDATGGLTIPGLGGPYDVSAAEDSGADSDINTLLANRTSDNGASHVIVSIHPNVVNQFMDALDQLLGSAYGQPSVPPTIEQVLLPPEYWDLLEDGNWSVRLDATAPAFTEPTGPEGLPQLQFPEVVLEFRYDSDPVATFEGTMTGIDLITEVRAGTTNWGPGFSTSNADLDVTRTQVHAIAAGIPPQASSAILPYAKLAFDQFAELIFVQYASFAPLSLGSGIDVELCPISSCGRYAGDERYTETFKIT